MKRLCPYCFYSNEPGTNNQCVRCLQDLSSILCCGNCGATRLDFAQYCYHCGQKLSSIIASGSSAAAVDEVECRATHFQQESLQLLHVQTGTLVPLPAKVSPIVIGKAGADHSPHIDVRDFPDSEVVSRQQASLYIVHTECAIADLNSTNGTYVNEVPLPTGHQHPLEFGDRINFGQSEKFTFLFIRELPINLKHLQTISGGDLEFEREILQTYDHRAHLSLGRMKIAVAQQDEALLTLMAEELTLSSHNVGAQVVHLLASQFHTNVRKKSATSQQQLLKVIEEALQKVRFFTNVYY